MSALDPRQRIQRDADLCGEVTETLPPFTPATSQHGAKSWDSGLVSHGAIPVRPLHPNWKQQHLEPTHPTPLLSPWSVGNRTPTASVGLVGLDRHVGLVGLVGLA